MSDLDSRLAKLRAARDAAPQPAPVPSGESSQSRPLTGGRDGKRSPRGNSGGSTTKRRNNYSRHIELDQLLDLVRLGRALAGELQRAGADEATVARESGYWRLGALLSHDLAGHAQRVTMPTLFKITRAAGITDTAAEELARNYPHAIAAERSAK